MYCKKRGLFRRDTFSDDTARLKEFIKEASSVLIFSASVWLPTRDCLPAMCRKGNLFQLFALNFYRNNSDL